MLVTMPHDPDPIPRGTKGTVVGGNGEQIWVSWDNGRALNLNVGVDVYAVIDDGPIDLDSIEQDQRHDCAEPGCQHAATYMDEAFCWYHEPPVDFNHDCALQRCKNWRA